VLGTADDVLTGQAPVVLAVAHGPKHLGEDLQAVAALSLQRPTEDFLGLAVRVGVGGVESGDAGVQGCAHACRGSVFLYLGAVGDPVAVGDLADDETAVAQMSKFHDGNSNGDGHGPAVRRNGVEVNKVCTGVLPR